MRAAEHERIDPVSHQRLQIACKNLVGDFIFQPAFFNQRHKQWAGASGNVNLRIERSQRPFVRATPNRRARSNYADVPVASRSHRRPCTGENDAGHSDWQSFFQSRQRQSGRGVAGDDNRLRVFREKDLRDLKAVAFDCARTFSAIGNSRRVAEVKNLFVREESPQFAHDGQPADAGIEDADRLRGLRAGIIRRH